MRRARALLGLATLGAVVAAVAAVAVTAEPPRRAPAAEPRLMVYRGAGCDGRDALPQFERFVGRRVDGVIEFLNHQSWPEMHSGARWAAECWSDRRYDLVIAVPMLPSQGGGTLKAGAAGEYDHHFEQLARTLVETGRGDATLRIGWEFNGGWYPWAAAKDPEAFVAYWRRIVRTMRSVEGTRFRFVWNPTLGWEQIPPDQVYPGDDVVDVIAADVYNQSWRPEDADPAERLRNLREKSYGLDWLARFAREHDKPLAIPEWGTGVRPDGHGFGDDPAFIAAMAQWMRRSGVEFHGYWDYEAHDYDAELSDGSYPRSGAAFRREFGPRR